ncbi:MAG TPA: hypothetical protein VKT80_03225, partial [Chloroflexota bacterium]|nr:hypothetical protein [Chloroflexota bacterium]
MEGPADAGGIVTYQLRITSLATAQPVHTQTLWKVPREQKSWPTLATAVGAKFLAVAGNNSHEIHLYSLASLLKGETKSVVLRSVGATYRQAAFIQNANTLGLMLAESPKVAGQTSREPKAGDTIFDLTKRKLAGEATGWKLAIPDLGEWRAATKPVHSDTAGKTDQWAVVVRKGNDEKATITLPAGRTITDFALSAPGKPQVNPILAVASESNLQPFLDLFDAVTGEKFRENVGHTDVVHSVAFSSDGRMLATAADDQTVNVWSLTTIDQILKKRGLLNGLPVKEGEGPLVWAKPIAGQVIAANLTVLKEKGVTEGDELEGVVEMGA